MSKSKSREDIITLIKQCLALSGSPNEHEAARAMEMAQALLEKHNLGMEDVKDAPEVDANGMVRRPYSILGRFKWRVHLVHYVSMRNFCKSVSHGKWDRDHVDVIGRAVNVAAVFEMVSWLLPQVERLGRQATRFYTPELDEWEQKLISKQAYRNSFMWGCIQRINNRMYEAQEERMEANPDVKGLVVRRDAEVQEYVAQVYGTLAHGSSARSTSSRGADDGYDAGDKVDLYGRRSRPDATPRLGKGGQ